MKDLMYAIGTCRNGRFQQITGGITMKKNGFNFDPIVLLIFTVILIAVAYVAANV